MTSTKQDAFDLFEVHRAEWLAEARAVAVSIAKERGYCTADLVREKCPVPDGIDGRVMGAVFKSDEWEAGEFINSNRATCHKRPIRKFRLAS